ncbi:hypothetical protein KC725_02110 [Candidatus Peregrinibacteria bacterium]|nr:hypothetical protein [Candidatus Peregrinibacteria bacterium]
MATKKSSSKTGKKKMTSTPRKSEKKASTKATGGKAKTAGSAKVKSTKKTPKSTKAKSTKSITITKKIRSTKASSGRTTKSVRKNVVNVEAEAPMKISSLSANEAPTNTFTIRQLDDVTPKIEPLVDAVDQLTDDIESMEDQGDNLDMSYQPIRKPSMRVEPVDDLDDVDSTDDFDSVSSVSDIENIPPKDIIKVRFGTFVNLVTNHDMEEVVAENAEKELIMEANLLTELASSRDQREERRVPLVFLVGIALGVVLTYIFFST